MDAKTDASQIDKITDLAWPEAGVVDSVPFGVFTDPATYELEQERLFRPTWNFLALAAEIPESGDFKSTFIGDTPVVVTRNPEGEIHAWVNRCAHRGAMVCREIRGNSADGTFTCVYHQWAFDPKGDLIGVPFRRGLAGKGGYPKDFDMKDHGLQKVRVENYHGLVFGTFNEELVDVEEYLGGQGDVTKHMKRILNRPLKVLGTTRQFMNSNWKIYAENTKDPYHASLLHLFHMTFGLYRSSQTGGVSLGDDWHSVLYSEAGTDNKETLKETKSSDLRTYQEGYTLNDPSLLAGRKEYDDGVTLVILSIMPSLVVQQIQNTLAVRQILPKGVDKFELIWTYFGYADDDAEMDAIREKQFNLIGPSGLISMEDGEACELVQTAIVRDADKQSCIQMSGRDFRDEAHLVTEAPIRSFWSRYRQLLDF